MKTDTPRTAATFAPLWIKSGPPTDEELNEVQKKFRELERERNDAISRLAQATQEREHNAYQALMWRGIAERLKDSIVSIGIADHPIITNMDDAEELGRRLKTASEIARKALAAFEEAKK
jgi:uncharacterized protein YlxW (UPF0749 family)